MNAIRLAPVFLILVFSMAVFAETGLPQAEAANEVDIERCTRSSSNMKDYCMGYCDKYAETSCTSAAFTYSGDDIQVIDECVCTCGVEQETVTFTDVPCGDDLVRYGTPSGEDYGSSGCCLPALVLGALGFACFRR
jgi:hypothetical protein